MIVVVVVVVSGTLFENRENTVLTNSAKDLPKICQERTRSTKGAASKKLQRPLAETNHDNTEP